MRAARSRRLSGGGVFTFSQTLLIRRQAGSSNSWWLLRGTPTITFGVGGLRELTSHVISDHAVFE
jgi:hypothetical protein